ncbi:MAG: hypothetical protein UZ14_CFX002000186 [Chloroflexi bacterium OLB14]|nr:MAG: hypothetical protein UZ14_CFX002000186 [Chloroflexi bacterium OLB14]
MVTLTLSDQQVVELVKQLPLTSKQAVLDALMNERELWWNVTVLKNEEQLRLLASQRGLNWDAMPDDKREEFVDEILHE